MRMGLSDAGNEFDQGIDLFNDGRFFACHETWEETWKRTTGVEKQFVQGLIQIAAAILHAERGNARGAASTYRKACAKLDGLPAEYGGIALGDLRTALARFFAIAFDSSDLPRRPLIRRVDERSGL
jgi:uncharacterized protein